MQVTQIWRFPVKSMQGERLTEARVGEQGVAGDRAWSLVDRDTDTNLTARRTAELLLASARIVDGDVVITLPDGTETNDDEALSAWLGRGVELRAATTEGFGTFETQADETETGEWFQWQGPRGSFHDSSRGKISLVSRDRLRDWALRRFRINVILDEPGDTELVGGDIKVGEVAMSVTKQIDRCIMTTRPQPAHESGPAIERDLDVLRTINRENDTFLGIGALITGPGTLRVGDQVTKT